MEIFFQLKSRGALAKKYPLSNMSIRGEYFPTPGKLGLFTSFRSCPVLLNVKQGELPGERIFESFMECSGFLSSIEIGGSFFKLNLDDLHVTGAGDRDLVDKKESVG